MLAICIKIKIFEIDEAYLSKCMEWAEAYEVHHN